MSVSLSVESFVLASYPSVPSRLLREAAGVRMLQKCLPFLAYVATQHKNTPYGLIAGAFLEEEKNRFDTFTWSPVFRAWYADVVRLPDWDVLKPEHEVLLKEFCALILRPEQPQDYLLQTPIVLSPGKRYSPVELDWCWIADASASDIIMPASLVNIAQIASTIDSGDSVQMKIDNCTGTLCKAVHLDDHTWISNFHPRLKVYLSGTNQRTTGVVHEIVDWDSYPDSWDIEPYIETYRLMAEVWPEEYEDQLETLKVIVPMIIPDRYQHKPNSLSFTLSSHQGAIFLTAAPPMKMLEMALHEKAHVKQRYIEEVWQLLENEQTETKFAVPWRPDPRPIVGIFEGINVFLQVLVGLVRCYRNGYYDTKKRVLELFSYLEIGLEIIGNNARMTADGRAYYNEICKVFLNIRKEFVESNPQVMTTKGN